MAAGLEGFGAGRLQGWKVIGLEGCLAGRL